MKKKNEQPPDQEPTPETTEETEVFTPIPSCTDPDQCPLHDENCECRTPAPPPEDCIDCRIHRFLHEREARAREIRADLIRVMVSESEERLARAEIKSLVTKLAELEVAQHGESAQSGNAVPDDDPTS